ncbi:hypothetical protein ACFQ3Z_44415 [Streptomyces nogalater]
MWLAIELCPVGLFRDRFAAAVVAWCRNDHVESSASGLGVFAVEGLSGLRSCLDD